MSTYIHTYPALMNSAGSLPIELDNFELTGSGAPLGGLWRCDLDVQELLLSGHGGS